MTAGLLAFGVVAPLAVLSGPARGPGLLAGASLLAAGIAWFWRLDMGRVARFADASAGLNAAADTALHLAARHHPAAAAVALDALDGLAGAKPPPARPAPVARWALVGLLLAGLLAIPRGVEPPPPPPDPHAEVRAKLDDMEARARREGQQELVSAVRALRMRLEEAWEEEAEVARTRPPEAPKPLAPPPKPSPQSPAPGEGLSPEAWSAALDQAQLRLSDDEMELKELTRLLEEQLVEITAFQKSADSLLFETMALNGMENPFSDFQSVSPMASAQNAMRNINQNQEFMERGMGPELSAANPPGMQKNEMDKASHERTHALQQSYHDFLKAYAESMRDELAKAMKEVAEQKSEGQGSPGNQDGLDMNGSLSGVKKGETQSQSGSLQAREGGAEQAAARLAELGDKGEKATTGISGSGTGESTQAGGKGAGTGPSGEGEKVDGDGANPGQLEQLSGQFNPGTLDREEQLAALNRVSELAAASGAGSEFDDAWNGYFDEVERTLGEEELPPLMEGMVRAYFAGLREEN